MISIIGTWRLCSIEIKNESGEVIYPFGRKVKGLVLYQNDGYMSGIITAGNQPDVTSPVFKGISDDERVEISKQFNAYAGSYFVEKDKIIHNIEVSFVPNLMHGKEHICNYSLIQNRMILTSTVPQTDISLVITWEKANNPY